MAERKGEKQKLKMLYLAKIFYEETDDDHYLTMPEIIKKLAAYGVNADRKTIYQNIAELKDFGFDILTSQDGRNYYYYLGNRDFELAELKLLVDAVQSSKFISENKTRELISKIESLTSSYEAKKLHRQVLIAGRVKTMNESVYYNVDKLHEAINSGRQIRFRYYDWDLDKKLSPRYGGMWYTLSPWTLMWDDEKYYVVGYDAKHGTIIHYRVDKMKEIDILDEARDGKEAFEGFNLADYTKALFGMYAGEETKVTLEGKNNMVGVLIDRFGKDLIIVPVDAEHFQTTVTVAVSSHFLGWIISLGGGIRIAGPDSVVEQMKNMINQLSEQYNS